MRFIGGAELFWRHNFHVLEDAREIALVAEAADIGDFRQRPLRGAEQIAGKIARHCRSNSVNDRLVRSFSSREK